MNGRSIPFMPLGILLLLAGLTFWLSRYAETSGVRDNGKSRHDPDVIVEKFTARSLSPTGDVQYVVTANKMNHFPDDDSSTLETVVFTSTSPGQAPIVAKAPVGRSFEGGDRIVMEGGVVVETSGTKKNGAMTMRTPKLTILPPKNLASSVDGVVVESAQGVLKAVSFELNNETEIVNFGRGSISLTPPRR